jgi:hypothetical protein
VVGKIDTGCFEARCPVKQRLIDWRKLMLRMLIAFGGLFLCSTAASAAAKTETIFCNKGLSFTLVYSPRISAGSPAGVWPSTLQLMIAGKQQGELRSDPNDADGATWSNPQWSLYQFKAVTTLTDRRHKISYDCR